MIDTPKMPRGRRGHRQWRDMMAAATACLQIDAALQFGLIEGGPKSTPSAAPASLGQGKARGFSDAGRVSTPF
jgi:hypothetical protein